MSTRPTARAASARPRQAAPQARVLVWCGGARAHEAVIARAAAQVATVVPCQTEPALLDELAHPGRALVLIEVSAATRPTAAALVRLVKRHHPEVPVLGYCWLGPAISRQIVAAARVGLDALALRGYDDIGAAVRALLANEQVDETFVLRALDGVVPDDLLPWAQVAMERATEGPNGTLVARALGCSPRTMQRLASRHGTASPAEIVTCTRLLYAARLLAHRRLPVDEAAARTGYPTREAMRRAFGRHGLASPDQVRGSAAWRTARDRLLARMGGAARPTFARDDAGMPASLTARQPRRAQA